MRPTMVSIAGIASPDADGVCASQKVPTPNGTYSAFVIDGALSTGYSAAALSTAASGVTTATLTAAAGNIAPARQIVLVHAGDDSAKTVAVVGLAEDGVTAQSETVTGSNASRTATTKLFSKVTSVTVSSASAGNFSVGTNGYVATLTQPRRVAFTSAGNDTSRTWIITGTDVNGNTISETVTGASGAAAYTVLSYKTVTKILATGSYVNTITVGEIADSVTGGAATTRWVRLDEWAMGNVAFQVSVTGTVSYTVQQSLQDPTAFDTTITPATMTWVNHPDTTNLVAATASAQGNYMYPPMWARVVLNSGSGSLTARFSQSNVVSK